MPFRSSVHSWSSLQRFTIYSEAKIFLLLQNLASNIQIFISIHNFHLYEASASGLKRFRKKSDQLLNRKTSKHRALGGKGSQSNNAVFSLIRLSLHTSVLQRKKLGLQVKWQIYWKYEKNHAGQHRNLVLPCFRTSVHN